MVILFLLLPNVLCCGCSLQVYWTLFVTISLYTMLPLCMTGAIVAGLACSASHIIVLSVYVTSTSKQPAGDFALQVGNASYKLHATSRRHSFL